MWGYSPSASALNIVELLGDEGGTHLSSLFDRFDEGARLSALGKSEKTADPKRRRESQGSSLPFPFRSFPFAARRVIVIMPGWKIIGGWGSGKLRRYLSLMHVLDATEREESVGGPRCSGEVLALGSRMATILSQCALLLLSVAIFSACVIEIYAHKNFNMVICFL